KSPLVVTSARLAYHGLRGLMRSFSADLPVKRSQVHLTSVAVKGLPSCHLTPLRNGRVNSVPSSFQFQPVASSGTIACMLFFGSSCLNRTRLLKIPMPGRLAATVDSSCTDRLAGLSKCGTRRIPPDFWASTGWNANSIPAVANAPKSRLIPFLPFNTSLTPAFLPVTGDPLGHRARSQRRDHAWKFDCRLL